MTNGNNDVRELEDLLTELEGEGALPVGPYSDEDDAVTQLMDAPLGEQEWMVQITPQDRRMMSTEQLLSELATGNLVQRDMLVWRTGMSDWTPIARVEELAGSGVVNVPASLPPERRPPPAPLPPPAPAPPPRFGSSAMASPAPSPGVGSTARAPLPPVPSAPMAAPRPPTPVPDVPPPAPLPHLNSAFGSPGTPPIPPAPGLPSLDSAFDIPPAAPGSLPPVARASTQRPVAVDFSEIEVPRSGPTRVLVGSAAAALVMIVGTVYALSTGGVFESNTEVGPELANARPAAAATSADEKPAAVKPAAVEPAAENAVAMAEPGTAQEEDTRESEPQTQPASAKEELVMAPPMNERSEPEEAQEEEASPEAEAQSSDTDEVASSPSRKRAERRQRKAKRASAARDRRSAPRGAKARAAAAPTAVAPAEAPTKASDPPGSTFNRQAAKTALDAAASRARNCRPQGGPSGPGRVQVRYEPDGKVGDVSLLTPAFNNTTTGACVEMVFRRASIPAFTGSPAVVMNKSFEIP